MLGLVLADDFGSKGTLKRQKRDNAGDEAMDGMEEEDTALAELRAAFKNVDVGTRLKITNE